MAGYGVFNIAVGVPKCQSNEPAFCVGVFTPAVVGLMMSLWSLVVHSQSARDLESRPPANRLAPSPPPAPTVVPSAPPAPPPAEPPALPPSP